MTKTRSNDSFINNKITVLVVVCIIIQMMIVLYWLFFNPPRAYNPYVDEIDDVIEIGNWIDKNTPSDSLFLMPPNAGALRVWSKRSVVFSTFYPIVLVKYHEEWQERCDDVVGAYNQNFTEVFVEVAQKYGASYIVTYKQKLELPERFGVGNFNVYELENSSVAIQSTNDEKICMKMESFQLILSVANRAHFVVGGMLVILFWALWAYLDAKKLI